MIRLTAVIELEGQAPRALAHESNARAIVLGRDPAADFQIPLTTVSRGHAKISETDGIYVIEDLGSTHGTLLNGRKLTKGDKKVLRDGDIIELTKAKITCNVETEKVASMALDEGTNAIAARAVQGILGRLGESQGEGPYFRVLVGPEEGQRFELKGPGEWTLGRSKDCEFVLNDPNVSRRHGTVRKDWSGFTMHDLGSKNGVLVNDRRIAKPRRLKDRDEVTIGPVKLIYIDPDAELMSALSGVPGFDIPDEAEEPMEPMELDGEPSRLGAPDSGEDGDGEGDAYQEESPESPEEEYDNIDPNLLQPEAPRRFPFEWLIIGGVGALIIACVALLAFLLG
ncbi:MAG: FHA domain-containing protein [Myxococcota bacterium]